jgi:hypothetical protein
MIVKNGSICYQSERGEKDKFYPDLTSMIAVSQDEKCDRLPWLPSGGLVPVFVERYKMALWCKPEDLA